MCIRDRGVYKPELLDTVSRVAANIGYTHALFVHGLDGLDEISLLGETRVQELRDGEIETYTIAPEDFGLKLSLIHIYGIPKAGGNPQPFSV